MKVGDQITSHILEKSDATYKFDKLINLEINMKPYFV